MSANKSLREMYHPLSTNRDTGGQVYVSSFEARDVRIPFYAVQWHPEANNFNWRQNWVCGSGSGCGCGSVVVIVVGVLDLVVVVVVVRVLVVAVNSICSYTN